MNFAQSVSTCLRKSFTFKGRASRSECWWFTLFRVIVVIVGILSDVVEEYTMVDWNSVRVITADILSGVVVEDVVVEDNDIFISPRVYLIISYVSQLISIATIPAAISVSVRRLHDMNRSGWWFLIVFTGIGVLILTIWFMFPSDPNKNKYDIEEVKT